MVSRKGFLKAIRDRVASGEWRPGTKLPPTWKLAEEYEVSESMVNQAMAALLETGEIRTVPGGARYVAGAPNGNGAEGNGTLRGR